MELVKSKGMIIFLVLVMALSIIGSINNNRCKEIKEEHDTFVQNI